MAASNRIPADWISEKSLREAYGVSHVQILKWRRYGLLPTPVKVRRLGRGRGTETFHPPEIGALLQRINELRLQSRSMETWLWTLWLDPVGSRIDIVAWCQKRLAKIFAGITDIDQNTLEIAATRKPGRSDPRRAIYARLTVSLWYALMKWAAAIAAGRVPIPRIYDDGSDALRALGIAGALSVAVPDGMSLQELLPEPDCKFSIEDLSPIAVLDSLRNGEIERVRENWRQLARIAELLQRAEAICLSGNRQAVKAAFGAVVPPLIALPLVMWRDFNGRAVFLPGLIGLRRLPGYGERIDAFLPALEQVFTNVLQQAGGERP
jgi:hypothetical protein